MPVTDTDDLLARADYWLERSLPPYSLEQSVDAQLVADLRAEVERLQAENAKLRDQLDRTGVWAASRALPPRTVPTPPGDDCDPYS